MRPFLTLLATIALLATPVLAYGQVEMPDKLGEPGLELVAKIKSEGIPPEAKFDGGWKISCTNGAACRATFRKLEEPNAIGIWIPDAGNYQVTYSGFWLLTKEVTFKDGAGNDVTITSYLGHGFINESAGVVVGTPVPPPPPVPEGPWALWIVENQQDRDNLTANQLSLITGLSVRQKLQAEHKHVLQEIVQTLSMSNPPERLRSVVAAAQSAMSNGMKPPLVVIAPLQEEQRSKDGVVAVHELPATYEDLVSLLDHPVAEKN